MILRLNEKQHSIARFLENKWCASTAIPLLIYAAAVLAFIQNPYAVHDFPLDDAWIHRVYAQSLAFGHGLAYNDGQQEAGSTSPLWSLVTAPAHGLEALGTDSVVFAVKAIGVLLGLICVLRVQRIAARLTGSQRAGGIAAALFAMDPKFLFSTLSGMETCLLVALLVSACWMLLDNKPWQFLALISLAPVTRPEALIVLPCALAGILSIWQTHRRFLPKVLACLVPILPMTMWVCFCLLATGHLLPNTFYIKARPFLLGMPELMTALTAVTQYGLVAPVVFLAGIVAFGVLSLRKRMCAGPVVLFLALVPLVYVLGVVGSRKVALDGYYWTRWIDPAAHLLTMAFCIGCAFALTTSQDCTMGDSVAGAPARPAWMPFIPRALGVALLFSSVPTYVDSFADRRGHLASDARVIAITNVRMGRWIEQHTPKDAVVGVNDAGAIRYFGQRHTVDLLGLNNADIAFHKVTALNAMTHLDWLVIFPALFNKGALGSSLAANYESRLEITIPPEEYTICNSASQTYLVAFQRKQPVVPVANPSP